ncbi:hypothetical protein EJB05_08302, partial [Eragrostis curvula]
MIRSDMDASMTRLRDFESRLPPGFRFHPSDEELVFYYLRGKVHSSELMMMSSPAITMVEVDLHVREPWELPEAAKLSDKEWYFFSFRDRKYATGSRTNRATKHGYWKATGKDKVIHEHGMMMEVGMRKTLVFYFGRAPNGRRSDWVMHEFRLVTSVDTPPTEGWVLCRVFHKGKGEADHAGGSDKIFGHPGGGSLSPPQPPAYNLDGLLFPITVSSSSPITNDMPDPAMLQQLAPPDAGFDISAEATRVAGANHEMLIYDGERYMQEMDMALLEGGNYYF